MAYFPRYRCTPIRWTVRAVASAPIVLLILFPLTLRNYRRRWLGIEPDRWYWGDVWMMRCGWWMKMIFNPQSR